MGYNRAALSYGKKVVAFILAKVILNVDVFMSYKKMHEYKRTTTFSSTTVKKTVLVHDRKIQRDRWDWIQRVNTEGDLGNLSRFEDLYQDNLIGPKFAWIFIVPSLYFYATYANNPETGAFLALSYYWLRISAFELQCFQENSFLSTILKIVAFFHS